MNSPEENQCVWNSRSFDSRIVSWLSHSKLAHSTNKGLDGAEQTGSDNGVQEDGAPFNGDDDEIAGASDAMSWVQRRANSAATMTSSVHDQDGRDHEGVLPSPPFFCSIAIAPTAFDFSEQVGLHRRSSHVEQVEGRWVWSRPLRVQNLL